MTERSVAARVVLGAVGAAVVALGGASSALAAGSGYGGKTTPATNTPTGFSSVVVVHTEGTKGGTVSGSTSGGKVVITVPKGASKKSFQVAITKGNATTVKTHVAASLKGDTVVSAFGVELKSGSSAVKTSKQLTVTFSKKSIAKGDIVVVYNAKTGKFTKVTATVVKGKVTIHLKAGESLAVLAPKKKK